MSIGNSGRRWLIGLLAGAPVATVSVTGEGKEPQDGTHVNIFHGSDAKVTVRRSGASIDVIVEAVERRMASRLSRGEGDLGKAMEASYGLQRAGR